jgi:hypothetical protein
MVVEEVDWVRSQQLLDQEVEEEELAVLEL